MPERLICPKGCNAESDTPFFYAPSIWGGELGVLAYRDGAPSNRFQDGTAGVPAEIVAQISGSDDFPHCVQCCSEARWEVVCPRCGERVWDVAFASKLNKCWNCMLAFDSPEEEE